MQDTYSVKSGPPGTSLVEVQRVESELGMEVGPEVRWR